jgi:hypothetical protein
MQIMEEKYKSLILDLQKLRGGVKTFVLMDDISGRSLLRTRLALDDVSGEEIDIILHSPGGQPADAYRLIRSFKEKYNTVNIIVPLWAKSAATLFAFGASRLVMHEYGELGPIDAQIRKDDEDKPSEAWESALNVQSSLAQIEDRSSQNFVNLLLNLQRNPDVNIGRSKLAEMLLKYNSGLYAPLLDKIDTYEMGRMARYLDIGKMYAKRILNQYGQVEPEQLIQLLDFLVYDCPDHGYVVDYAVLKNYLPNVIKSTEKPFGTEYDKKMTTLSEYLMAQQDEIMVGFIDVLTQPKDDATIKKGAKNDDETSEQTTQPKRPGSKPTKNGSKTKPKKK